jgi:hypothetical protein
MNLLQIAIDVESKKDIEATERQMLSPQESREKLRQHAKIAAVKIAKDELRQYYNPACDSKDIFWWSTLGSDPTKNIRIGLTGILILGEIDDELRILVEKISLDVSLPIIK